MALATHDGGSANLRRENRFRIESHLESRVSSPVHGSLLTATRQALLGGFVRGTSDVIHSCHQCRQIRHYSKLLRHHHQGNKPPKRQSNHPEKDAEQNNGMT
jgi:hypothetical protein